MIFDISDEKFLKVMNMSSLDLPKRWAGVDFEKELKDLFSRYLLAVNDVIPLAFKPSLGFICDCILEAIRKYLNGYTHESYIRFSEAMDFLYDNPLIIHKKENAHKPFNPRKDLTLYRVRYIQGNATIVRKMIFHAPNSKRAKIATCRYSIPGFPSLYLGTTIKLCREESPAAKFDDQMIASRFEMNTYDVIIKVLDLSIKPSDFVKNERNKRKIGEEIVYSQLSSQEIRCSYLFWYPLIAGCSYMRTDKSDPFAVEYILPQFLMQWIRSKYVEHELIGIRYFSCASTKASRMGYNYVFPVSGKWLEPETEYCEVLARVFKLTEPRYLREHENMDLLERNLNSLVAGDFS